MKDDIYYVVFTSVSSAYNDHHIMLQQYKMTALLHACQSGSTEVVKLLIERGMSLMDVDDVSNAVTCAYM